MVPRLLSLLCQISPRNQMLYDSSFALPILWNKVPAAIKAEKKFDGFKVSSSKFLALMPDNPPVSGYTCSWSNSLVDFTSTRWSDDDRSYLRINPNKVIK